VVCLSIAEKINSVQPIRVCGLEDIDLLITELPPEDALLKPYVDAGLKVA
jgi:DeoR/GlpR family transcriptional regulator of sugar metabolism